MTSALNGDVYAHIQSKLSSPFTDFAVPHVAECILGKTAFLTPRFKHHAKAFSVLQIRLDLLADSGEVTAMQFDAILW